MEYKWSAVTPLFGVAAVLSVLVPCAASGTVVDLAPGVRSWSLGIAGAADESDPANAFFNPAIIAFSEGAFVTGGYGKLLTFITDDIYTYNVGAGCGFRGEISGVARIRFGAAVRYSFLNWGEYEARDQDNNYLGVFEPRERSLSVTAGVGGRIRGALHGSVGVSVKPWWYDDGHVKDDNVSLDLGIILKADFAIGSGMRLSPSVGVGFLNLNGGDTSLRNNRYAVGVRLAGASSRFFRERFDIEVPAFAAMALFDYVADRSNPEDARSDGHGLGAEVSLAQVLFARIGDFGDQGSSGPDSSTYGVGVGLPMRRSWCRFDYASVSQSPFSKRTNKFGLSFGLTF